VGRLVPNQVRHQTSETTPRATVAHAAKTTKAFLVYTSVANADKRTEIPLFDSKVEVEKHSRAIGAESTIIAPVYLMENLFFEREPRCPAIRRDEYVPVA
jgi:uncharacterized protein YbjT (DUF2867 family)